MNHTVLSKLTVDELVEHFAELALEQDRAMLMNDQKTINRLFWGLEEIEEELKARDGDQRRSLSKLYEHPNAQVRVKAAKATLAVFPAAALRQLQRIKDLQEYPQALEAGMSLWNLERGVFKPT